MTQSTDALAVESETTATVAETASHRPALGRDGNRAATPPIGAGGVGGAIKEELCAVTVIDRAARLAELSTLLRFGARLKTITGATMIEVELDSLPVVRRLQRELAALFGVRTRVLQLTRAAARGPDRYLVRIGAADRLARHAGLMDPHGRPMLGLHPAIVSGGPEIATAAIRGAFLASGHVDRGRIRMGLAIACPGPLATSAVLGMARKLEVLAEPRYAGREVTVTIRGADPVVAFLERIGADRHAALLAHSGDLVPSGVSRSQENFTDANHARAVQTAVRMAERARLALGRLGDLAPDHLRAAGELRMEYPTVGLAELGSLADPPMSKDTIAGRVRRLILIAEALDDPQIPGNG
ncbi:DNA-binding protein WhiA [Aldersonia sp. NBC_00410]|uniref:DNA-binding protein WhiA n=1 Tax=Aldersonia sp. NBC_00410 TaxID=2975954 RepID=UPI002253599C|nr:DNA-binding protein WhiA [Aldersonia sp. NBC_00410]MCX5046255.1 DNA-binding protein WhiA [Aldersonia sp. NBC_00410]